MKRCDNWTVEQDQLLVETILRYVREGSTQLQAFDDVGEQIDRSGAACGYRWNLVLRKNYTEALRIARRIRRGQTIK